MTAGKIAVPHWLNGLITSQELDKISAQVTELETQSDGEVVPMIVKGSTPRRLFRYFLFLMMATLVLAFEIPQHEFLMETNLIWLVPLLLIFCFWFSGYLARVDSLLRLFVPQDELSENVEKRALLEFYLSGVKYTKNRTGILIFISLAERKVVVLGDQSISSKISPETWSQICHDMVEKIKSGQLALALEGAILKAGGILKEHFPAHDHNPNELCNGVVIKE